MENLTQLQEKIDKVISNLKKEFLNLKTGRANPHILDKVQVEYYGDKVSINQLASVISPECHQILVKPYDKNDLKAVSAAIISENLDLNPIIDGEQIRINIPGLTEETRINIVKKAKQLSDNAKIVVRNIRHDYLNDLKDNDEYSEDFKKKIQNDVQKIIDKNNMVIDDLFNSKEKEILAI